MLAIDGIIAPAHLSPEMVCEATAEIDARRREERLYPGAIEGLCEALRACSVRSAQSFCSSENVEAPFFESVLCRAGVETDNANDVCTLFPLIEEELRNLDLTAKKDAGADLDRAWRFCAALHNLLLATESH